MGRINGEDELVFELKIIAKEMQKQSSRQWKFSIFIAGATFLVGISDIIAAVLGK